MAPTPQEHTTIEQECVPAPAVDGERIVISGMSGLYPSSHHVKEFSDILYNKINPVSTNQMRWVYNHPEAAQHIGTVPDVDRFDAQFFKVHYRLGNCMDTMSRKILEQAYQAIYDAGINPEHLSGKKIGVFVGACFSETDKACFYDASHKTGLGITGCCKAMFANRISYWLNAKGPSMAMDEACCSSTAALEQALYAIKRGDCEAAIVGGTYLSLHPKSSVNYGRIVKNAKDGKTKSFDENADGSVKSEVISVLYLQKAKDARRVYADVLHAKSEYIGMLDGETGPQFGFLRNPGETVNFLNEFYEEARVPPQAVEYVEAFGSAVPEADKVELEVIDKVFCTNKDDTLLVGSVTSNIGYSEAASGLSAVTKVLLGYHNGELAANLHCSSPRQDVQALREGRMRVLTEHQRFRRTYVAVNGMSYSGINSHVLLHGHYKPKDLSRYKTNIPHLVTLSARRDIMVKKVIENLKSRSIDPEELALLHNIHESNVAGHLGRGFIILKTNEDNKTVSLCEKAEYFDNARRPLWFVYSGMGSQWAGMGTELMRIPIFAAAIERCRQALEPRGIDIVHIITSPDKKIFDNILHSFVGIAAIQIGLTDVLRELGLMPDGIIGHSVGELGCAYADGCMTVEEMILSAYSRGLVSLQTPFIRGSMAAVGLGYEKISELCPPEIEIACHNGPESSTISGPADLMREFVTELTSKGIFAKEVPCSNIAYHSRYIADAGPGLLKYLSEVIKTPKRRSERWVSTSVPEEKWNASLAQYSSAEYHTNNLLNPVLFEETLHHIPNNAVLVEIAPHGLLQAILKRSLPANCRNIAVTRRGHPDGTYFLLEAIGKLYMEGYNPKVQILYPKVEMPVSTGTPFLSHLIEWAHEEKWAMPLYRHARRVVTPSCNYVISLHDKENMYLQGHVVREKTLYPFAASLVTVWDTLAMFMEVPRKHLSVEFQDLHLYAQPVLHDQRQLRIRVIIQRVTGNFEVLDENIKIATGRILARQNSKKKNEIETTEPQEMNFSATDIYSLLQERNYSYSGEFRSIECANATLNEALLMWHGNWVTLIDGMLQMNVLNQTHDDVTLPTYIQSMTINVAKHENNVIVSEDKQMIKAEMLEKYDLIRCGGIVMHSIRYRNLPALNNNKMELQALKFVSNFQADRQDNSGGEYYIPVQNIVRTSSNVTLESALIGDFNSLNWVETSQSEPGISVTVHYAGLSNTDLKKASGIIPLKKNHVNNYGMDFSGITDTGERVMGLVQCGAASSVVRAQPELLWPVPAHWSLEDAATVPLAYAHAFYCLRIKMGLKKHHSILVHGGTGALGQAVIALALSWGCEVFTTVGSNDKKQFLLKLFPGLKADQVGNSRDHSFHDMVLDVTKERGCDVVICSTKGNLKNTTLKCVATHGICLDVSQLHNTDEDFCFGMYNLNKERHYATVDFTTVFNPENIDWRTRLHRMMSEGINNGDVRPLSRVTHAPCDVARAFHLLAASRHRGRVLLCMREVPTLVHPRLSCNPNDCQLIFIGEETFGLQLAERLVIRGARKLHIHHRGQLTQKFKFKLRLWEKSGVQIQISSDSLEKENDVTELFKTASNLASIQGVYIVNKSGDEMVPQTLFPHLDSVSRRFCPDLRYFAVINLGDTAIGQTTCLSRAQNKLPATVLTLPVLNNKASCCDVLDATESALSGDDTVVVARKMTANKPGLLQQLSALTGVCLLKNTPKTITLEDIGIKEDKLQLIKNFLRIHHNVDFTEEEMRKLTIASILHVEENENRVDEVKGLGTFLSYVDCDEIMATTEIVFLPTLSSGVMLNGEDLDDSHNYLCILPGIEGHHERFRILCERLKIPALVLQPGLDHPYESVRETAERSAQVLLNKTGLKNNFHLLGYETGVWVALEMAGILEDYGLTGTVYCVGLAPDDISTAIEENILDFTTEMQFHDAVVQHMFKLMVGDNTATLEVALKSATTWSQKVDVCVRTLLGRVPHSAQYARGLVEAALASIERARTYVPRVRALRSQLVLLRAATGRTASTMEALQRYSQRQVVVHQLKSPLAYVTNDIRCASIVNEHLETDILEAFEKKNICETYLPNADSYVIGIE